MSVIEVMFVFGNVKAGFAQVETPYIYATARSGLANNSGIVNVADVGGLYNGQWIPGSVPLAHHRLHQNNGEAAQDGVLSLAAE